MGAMVVVEGKEVGRNKPPHAVPYILRLLFRHSWLVSSHDTYCIAVQFRRPRSRAFN